MKTLSSSPFKVSEVNLIYKNVVPSSQRIKITGSVSAFEILHQHWAEETIELKEEFKILLLNRANKVLGISLISSGGVSGTLVDPKLIFATALKANCSGIILAHNHPSGIAEPSSADRQITKRFTEAVALIDVRVLDHIVVGDGECVAFSERGWI